MRVAWDAVKAESRWIMLNWPWLVCLIQKLSSAEMVIAVTQTYPSRRWRRVPRGCHGMTGVSESAKSKMARCSQMARPIADQPV